MPKTVVIDELHLTFRVRKDLPDERADAVRRALAGSAFMNRLRRAIWAAVRAVPELSPCRTSLTR